MPNQFSASPMPMRFWEKVDKSGECWLWTGSLDYHGYGRFKLNGKTDYAHRIAYALTLGAITAEQHLCHSCDNPRCVNPSHLTPGTMLDNMRDMVDKGRSNNQAKTHCPSGHEYSEQNTYLYTKNYKECRGCRICRADAKRRQNAKDKLARAARKITADTPPPPAAQVKVENVETVNAT